MALDIDIGRGEVGTILCFVQSQVARGRDSASNETRKVLRQAFILKKKADHR